MNRCIEDIACVVLAKQNSIRLENKMLRPFAKSCLLDICLKTISHSTLLKPSQCWLSAGEPDIINIGQQNNWQIWHRGQDTLEGSLPLNIYHDFLSEFKHKWILKILATNPLLSPETLDSGIQAFLASKNDGLITVHKEQKIFFKKNGDLVQTYKGEPHTYNTRLIEPLYSNASCFYIWDRKFMLKENLLFNNPLYFEIPNEELVDIDELWQFENAEAIYNKRKKIT